MALRNPSNRRVMTLVTSIALAATSSLDAQSTVRVDVANDGTETVGQVEEIDISDDGTRVAFMTFASGLDPADTNSSWDVLVRDLAAGTTTLVSIDPNGEPGDGDSYNPRISADGRCVAFTSYARNLVEGDDDDTYDVFVRDLATGTTTHASVASDGTGPNGPSVVDAISADGNLVLFTSYASNLVADDVNDLPDVFLRDVAAGTTILVSKAADGTAGNGWCAGSDLSRDGRFAAYVSLSTNLVPGDTNGTFDVFVRNLADGTVTRASVDSNGAEFVLGGGKVDVAAGGVALSPDGTLVAFPALEAGPGDDNDAYDVYVRDLVQGTTTAVSIDSNGQFPLSAKNDKGTWPTGVSSDGRLILMDSVAVDLAANEISNPDNLDVYIRDRALAMTTRQSNDPSGSAGNRESYGSRMTSDGRHVAFVSVASNLIDGHSTSGRCAFLRTRPDRVAAASAYGSGLAGTLGVPDLGVAAPPQLNQPCDLTIGNSLGKWTLALLLIGTQSQDVPAGLGGELLVVPTWSLLFVIDPAGLDLREKVPPEEQLATMSLYLQALELDAAAPKGVSFTAGLQLDVGF